jgi:hypothetical protein
MSTVNDAVLFKFVIERKDYQQTPGIICHVMEFATCELQNKRL